MIEKRYVMRFFFDYGTGACLWSKNEAARSRFGYPVVTDKLPVEEPLIREAIRLAQWYDQSLDWDDPAGPSPWNESEKIEFDHAVEEFIHSLQNALGDDFLVIDEFRRLAPG